MHEINLCETFHDVVFRLVELFYQTDFHMLWTVWWNHLSVFQARVMFASNNFLPILLAFSWRISHPVLIQQMIPFALSATLNIFVLENVFGATYSTFDIEMNVNMYQIIYTLRSTLDATQKNHFRRNPFPKCDMYPSISQFNSTEWIGTELNWNEME